MSENAESIVTSSSIVSPTGTSFRLPKRKDKDGLYVLYRNRKVYEANWIRENRVTDCSRKEGVSCEMNEMKRAEDYAVSIIDVFGREHSPTYKVFTYNYDLACEKELFQELVIQQIRIKGYSVKRRYDEDGINIMLEREEDVELSLN